MRHLFKNKHTISNEQSNLNFLYINNNNNVFKTFPKTILVQL